MKTLYEQNLMSYSYLQSYLYYSADQQNPNFNIKRLQLITEQSRTEIVVDSLDTLLYTHYDHPLPQE